MRRYHIQDRDDYAKYNRLCGSIHHLALRLSKLPSTDPFREKTEASLLGKCYDMGLVDIGNKMSDLLSKVTVSSFARRRLGVVMVRLKMSETVKQVSLIRRSTSALSLIAVYQGGHIHRARTGSSRSRRHHRSRLSCHS